MGRVPDARIDDGLRSEDPRHNLVHVAPNDIRGERHDAPHLFLGQVAELVGRIIVVGALRLLRPAGGLIHAREEAGIQEASDVLALGRVGEVDVFLVGHKPP